MVYTLCFVDLSLYEKVSMLLYFSLLPFVFFFFLLVLYVGNDTIENEKLKMPVSMSRSCWSSKL